MATTKIEPNAVKPRVSTSGIYSKAIETWGVATQCTLVQEELAELIVAISHWRRKRIKPVQVLSEVADVYIMCEQLRLMLGHSHEDLKNMVDSKLERLAEILSK